MFVYKPVDDSAYKQARERVLGLQHLGAGLVCFWLTLLFLLMLGFSYSFFWSAATMIYFLMRKRVDEAELDEVFLEEDEPEPPLRAAEDRGGDRLHRAAGHPAAAFRRSCRRPPVMTSPPPHPPAAETIPFSPPPPPPISRRRTRGRRCNCRGERPSVSGPSLGATKTRAR